MDIRIFKNEPDFVAAGVARIMQSCDAPQGERPRIALSGGSTPLPVYRALATQTDFIDATEFYQVDERWVPSNDDRSNQKMIRDMLRPHRFFPLNMADARDKAIADYGRLIRSLGPHPFDMVILGVGSDGHTASLFPHAESLTETTHWATHTTTDTHEGHDRMSLTFPPIMASKALLILLKGADKRHALEMLMSRSGAVDNFPALKLTEHHNLTIYWLE